MTIKIHSYVNCLREYNLQDLASFATYAKKPGVHVEFLSGDALTTYLPKEAIGINIADPISNGAVIIWTNESGDVMPDTNDLVQALWAHLKPNTMTQAELNQLDRLYIKFEIACQTNQYKGQSYRNTRNDVANQITGLLNAERHNDNTSPESHTLDT